MSSVFSYSYYIEDNNRGRLFMIIKWNSRWFDKEQVAKNDIEALVGEHLSSVSGLDEGSDEVVFVCESGFAIKLYHEQDCCEHVVLNDFDCDVDDFSGAKVLSFEEVEGESIVDDDDMDSQTWTFYKLETDRGGLSMRWLGSSNGYYSESVDVVGGVVAE